DVSGSGTTYTVTVNTGTGSGTIRLDVVDLACGILDSDNYQLGGTGAGNGNFSTGELYTICRTTPTISAGGPLTFCQGGSVTLTSSSATGNAWSPGGQTTQSINVTSSGSYTVTVTAANGCITTSAATVVTVNPLPAVTLADFTAVCSNAGLQ